MVIGTLHLLFVKVLNFQIIWNVQPEYVWPLNIHHLAGVFMFKILEYHHVSSNTSEQWDIPLFATYRYSLFVYPAFRHFSDRLHETFLPFLYVIPWFWPSQNIVFHVIFFLEIYVFKKFFLSKRTFGVKKKIWFPYIPYTKNTNFQTPT